ncbi:MAG: caspase family protein [Saprospirales bacterium]|nr:caspase family protein [Saprospirales bacterium]
MKPTLYALLAGVSNYLPPVAKLPGCANDLQRMKEYLEGEKADFQEVKTVTLLDKDATKGNIVKAFQEHLGQAKKGDVAYFYYSGHGTQEAADTGIWRFEPDGKLECLVCYDSVEKDRDSYRFLSNKELRWLIHQLWDKTGAHIVTVFDCCHSGENTRNVHLGEQVPEIAEKRLVARFGGGSFPKRDWSDFIFSKNIDPEDLRKKPMYEVIPEGKHIQLAACRNDESAYEVGGEGIFTKNLLDILRRSRGAVTYNDLRSRIKNYVKNQYMQTPQIYAQGGDLALAFTTFLGKNEEGRPLYGNVVKNKQAGWIMDMGALHGVSGRGQVIEVEVEGGKEKLKGQVTGVFPDYTTLRFEGKDEETAQKANGLKGYMADFQSAPIKIYLEQDAAYKKEGEKLKKELDAISNLSVTQKEFEADYCVITQKEGINGFAHLITYPGEQRYYHDKKGQKQIRPLVMPANNLDDTFPEKTIASHLKHIAQWEYVRNLHNPKSFLFRGGFPLELKMDMEDKTGQWEEIPLEKESWSPTLIEQNGAPAGKVTVTIKNKYNRKLYVSVVSLSLNFEAYPNFLNPPGFGLNPGEQKIIDTIYTPQGEFPLSLSCEPEVLAFNLPYSPAWLLFVASTEDNVDVTALELPALPGPLSERSRFIGAAKADQNANANDWITRLVELKMMVPKD